MWVCVGFVKNTVNPKVNQGAIGEASGGGEGASFLLSVNRCFSLKRVVILC